MFATVVSSSDIWWYQAVTQGKPSEVARQIAAGRKVDATDEKGNTALIWACSYPKVQTKTVSVLLKAGANPNAVGADGFTALHLAVGAHNLALASMLVSAGARVDLKNADGKTPVEVAAVLAGANGKGDAFNVYRYLLDHAATVRSKTLSQTNKRTPRTPKL